jgi:membrane protein
MLHLRSPDQMVERPSRISLRGWKSIVIRAVFAMGVRNLSVAAAGVAFYGFLSIFPALGLLSGVLGLFLDPGDLRNTLWSLRDTLPSATHAALEEHIRRLLAAPKEVAGAALIFGMVMGLWSANAAMRAVMMALNIAYGRTSGVRSCASISPRWR